MTINSLEFLLFFVIVFFFYYFPVKTVTNKFQNILLLLASYFFYGYADLKMLPLLVGVTVIYYFLGLGIIKFSTEERKNSKLTIMGVVIGVGLLLYFKYLNFFISSFSEMFHSFGIHTNVYTFNIILPIGISFFIFRLISYVIEVNRGTILPTKDIINFAAYVAFFPCLLSGPIDRPQNFLPQIERKRSFNYDMAVDGLRQILWGLFKKMVVADNVSVYVDSVWSQYSTMNGTSLILAAFFYSIQIYADFSGYSDMAIGVGKLLGIRVSQNFNYPYFAKNISDFWRRWHMSLTSWFTDYIYIPLGGSRCSISRHIGNTLIVFLLCGLWHGSNWTFILWGGYNGLLFIPYILRKKLVKSNNKKVKSTVSNKFTSNFFSIISNFVCVTFGWIIFRADSVTQAFDFIKGIVVNGLGVPFIDFDSILFAVIGIFALFLKECKDMYFPSLHFYSNKRIIIRYAFYLMTVILILLIGSFDNSNFIYFNF